MLDSNTLPVLIVGAGAAGTTLALALARQGVEFRLVDRLPGPSPYSRAVTVHARTLELLDIIDPLLARRFLDRGIHCPGYVMHYVDAAGKRRELRPGLDFTALPSRYPFLLLHRQDETEQHLRDDLLQRFGLAPEWGVSCAEVSMHDDGVQATLACDDERVEQLRCRYLVACDGANSRLRGQLGLVQDGSDYAETILQNLDVELHGFPDDAQWAHYCMGPGHFVMAVKLPGGFFRLLMSQPADKADAEATPLEVFGAILEQHFDGIRFGQVRWHSRWGSVVRLAHNYRQRSAFLAGDAAHVHSTAGGQGMNCCMQDALNLGWKLALVLKGQARPVLLDSYEAERKPIGRQVIDTASAIHELFMTGRSAGPEALAELARSGFLDDLVNRVSGLAYHYRGEQPPTADGLPGSGDRLPDLPLGAALWLSDLTRRSELTLLAVLPATGGPDAATIALFARIRARYPVVHCSALPGTAKALIPKNGRAQLYLVRPDGYLAVRCDVADTTPLDTWLNLYLI